MSEPQMKYFVLKPKSKFRGDIYARASRGAMSAYATIIADENPEMARGLRVWALTESHADVNIPYKKEESNGKG